MVLENLAVKHVSFGEGVVVERDEKYITVMFAQTQNKFVYPDIFERFLTLADGSVSEDILLDIKSSKMQKQAILDIKHEENLRAMTKGIVIPGKGIPTVENADGERGTNRESEDI